MVESKTARIQLIDMLLKRREEIRNIKEMQAIHMLAPLFSKIKDKLLNKIAKNQENSTRKPNRL
jgi:hypothetical protein